MKKDLMDKAAELVEKKGAQAVSMRDLAKKVGVSTMAAYRHYKSKDELLLAVAAYGFDRLTQVGNEAAGREETVQKKLEAVLFAYYQFGRSHHNLFELMFSPLKKKESLSSHFQNSARASYAQFARYVHEFIGAKKLKNQKFENQYSSAFWAYIHGMTVLASNGYLSAIESSPKEMEKKIKTQIASFVGFYQTDPAKS